MLGLENKVSEYITKTDNLYPNQSYKVDFAASYSSESVLLKPKHTISEQGDILVVIPNQCKNINEYMVFRDYRNVDSEMTIDTRFYNQHDATLHTLDKAIVSIQRIRDEMYDYTKAGNLDRLIAFGSELGYSTAHMKMPNVYAATDKKSAAAFTITHKFYKKHGALILGSGLDFDESIKSMSQQSRLPLEIITEFVLTEEMMHNMQPDWLHSLAHEKGYVALLEGHVKALQSLYFFQKAQTDRINGKHYDKLSKGLHNWYRQLIAAHVKLMGINITEEELEQLLDSESPDNVAKKLSKGARKKADPCNDGYISEKTAALAKEISEYLGDEDSQDENEEESDGNESKE